ncbi:MAG: mechanosensitive ion channel [Deltaproteobacteria bacterium]|nr:mechanosensitive ion channel [Deltaproteobacteria bacterium]
MKKNKKFILFFLSCCFVFSSFSHVQQLQAQSLPATPTKNLPENPIDTELNKLKSLYEDQVVLEERLKEGAVETNQEIEKTKYFLEISQVAPQEFKPFLKKWETLLSSYKAVLEDTQAQMEQLEQQQLRIDSNLRLYKLKLVDIKSQFQNTPQNSNLKSELNNLQQKIKSYTQLENELDNNLRLISKNLTELQNALTQCKQYFNQVNARWEDTRFSRLTYRGRPLITKDTFTLIHHEILFLLLEKKDHLESLKESFLDNFDQWKERFPFYLLFIPLSALISFALFQIQKFVSKKYFRTNETRLEAFFYYLGTSSFSHFIFNFVAILYSIFILGLENISDQKRFFLLWSVLGAYCFFLIFYTVKDFLFFSTSNFSQPLNGVTTKKIKNHILGILICLYFFIFFKNLPQAFEFDSELVRVLKAFFEITLFIHFYSFAREEWTQALFPQNPSLQFLAKFFRRFILALFVFILVADSFGYISFSNYLANASLRSLGLLSATLILKKSLDEFIDKKLFQTKVFSKISKNPKEWKNTFQVWNQLFLWSAFLYFFSSFWHLQKELLGGLNAFLALGFGLNELRLSVGLMLSVFLVFYLSTLLSKIIRGILEQNLYPKKPWDQGIQSALSTGAHYIITLAGIIFALKFLGFDVRNITVVAGAFGVGIGLGLQNLANNFASGIVLLLERPVKVGDIIQLGDLTGHIRRIGARATLMETGDHAHVLIPNGELISSKVINLTYTNTLLAISIPFRLPYGKNTEEIRKLILDCVKNHKKVATHPSPSIEIKNMGELSIEMQLKLVVNHVADKAGVQNDLMNEIERIFLGRGEIPIKPTPHTNTPPPSFPF